MSFSIPALELLIHELRRLPGVGEKTAQRLAFFILKQGAEYSGKLTHALHEVQSKVRHCPNCYSLTDEELCSICADPHREQRSLCLVEEPFDVIRLESIGSYKGLYHVLQGTISPLDGVGPEQLKITELLERIQHSEGQIHEVILAFDADIEGDTTSLYLSKILQNKGLKITRLAHGVPFGTDIDYIDSRTLGRAFENRVEI